MKKAAVIILIATMLSKLFGLAKDIALTYYYGASSISDAYIISLTVPSVLFGFIGAGITAGYIPIYSKIANDAGVDSANRYTNNLLNILLIICALIVIIGIYGSEGIVKLFASGFEDETIQLASIFTKISLLSIFFTATTYVFSCFLQIKGNYIMPAIIGVPFNTIVVMSIILSKSMSNVLLLAIGSVIAMVSQIVILLPSIIKKGFRYQLTIQLNDRNIKTMANIALPVIVGASVNQINKVIDRTIASQVAIGGISALNYAHKLNALVQGLFVISIITVMYPIISKLAAENNFESLKETIREAIVGIGLLVIPASIGVMAFSEPIIRVLFGRGEFDLQAISLTSSALFYYSIGMIGFGLREVLSRAFFSMADTNTPMVNAIIGILLNIILNIVLSRYLGIGGLALATSISAIATTVLLFISLRKKIGPLGSRRILFSFLKILAASIIMSILAKMTFYHLDALIEKQVYSLLISMIAGALSYFIAISFMNIDDVSVIISEIKRLFSLKKIT
ncbi:murein biosynthesis integral membrane protein MurJ [Candidatus Contubernalis alkaliaceticus]|uniref:murein biosynthesis integral membrane protein MurJ n=1 Tax=Candidatus Contubernalis alkaliaceticus TaxID=338645 RepID=UPI001F4C26DC|nr:murein biosynthesis integral membrane protein MurJ [Candidatus Contubernalis alkalaceticus]UNC93560.1 murein biosynthesis integral membrane protein MurJ [Candidatus Contubernalis alkalaceticus]